MKGSIWGLAFAAALVGGIVLAGPAAADHLDTYRSTSYYRGRGSEDIRHRQLLRDRLLHTAEQVRLAERNHRIGRQAAGELWRGLDRVHDFLRNDRNLTSSEFGRRMDDLHRVQRELQEALRNHGRRDDRLGRHGGGSRYGDGRYGRYDDYGYRGPDDDRGRYDSRGRYDDRGRYDSRGRYDDRGRYSDRDRYPYY